MAVDVRADGEREAAILVVEVGVDVAARQLAELLDQPVDALADPNPSSVRSTM